MTNKTAIKTERAKKEPPAKQDKQAKSKHYAKVSLSAATMSAALSDSFTAPLFPDLIMGDVIDMLNEKISTVQDGDMKPIEAMLIGQAQGLQTMFVSLGRQAASKSQLNQYTAFMNLALKAQSQSRATIQALVELKYPKQVAFVKQANIAGGNQQVNNTTNTPAHAKAIENQPNELLSEMNNATLDSSGTATTSGTNKAMATVAT